MSAPLPHHSAPHSSLLSLLTYERYEAGHPGFKRDVLSVCKEIRSLKSNPGDRLTILEIGAGPGTLLTQQLGKDFAEKGDTVYITDNDRQALEILHARTHQYVDADGELKPATQDHVPLLSPKLRIQPVPNETESAPGVIEWLRAHPDLKFDAIVSNGFMHHLLPEQLDEFYALAKDRLTPGGKIIMGEEHLDYVLSANMLEYLGLKDLSIKAFTALAAIADRLVTDYPGQDNALLNERYREQLGLDETKDALHKLGLDPAITPIELRKHLRPAVTVAHHVGYVMRAAFSQDKIKLPALEFMALASNLSTCEDYFAYVHKERAAGNYNDLAVRLMDLFIDEIGKGRASATDDAWEHIESGATQGGRVSAIESYDAVVSALRHLSKTPKHSPVAGIPKSACVTDPDIRFEAAAEGSWVKKGGNDVRISPCDHKMTPMELAKYAANHGFVSDLIRNDGNGYGGYSVKKRNPISEVTDEGNITFCEPQFGGMTVTVSTQSNSRSREACERTVI